MPICPALVFKDAELHRRYRGVQCTVSHSAVPLRTSADNDACIGVLQDNWLDVVAPHIQARISKYAANEIRFNLMAVIGDRQLALQQQLDAATARRQAVQDKLTGGSGVAAMDTDDQAGGTSTQQQQQQLELPSDEATLQLLLAEAEGNVAR